MRTKPTAYHPVNVVVRTVIFTSVLTTLYAAYSTWITPRFMQRTIRPQQNVAPIELPSILADNVEAAKTYLAAHPWTLTSRYQFRTPQAFVYTQSWKLLENEEVLFEPFALIWRGENDDPDKEPIRVVSQRARVKFAHQFDMADPNPGRVVQGSLEGHVEILGGDGLVIVGKDFHFSEKSANIHTPFPVKMRQGQNRGRARGMQIDLITNVVSEHDTRPAIAGFRAVKFLKEVQLDLVTTPKGQREPIPLRIECEESLEYDVAGSTAKFDGTVIVQRESSDKKIDELHCDELTFFFKPQPETSGTSPTATEVANGLPIVTGIAQNLTLDRVHADGEEVWLYSDEHELEAQMKQLVYNMTDRVITLTNPESYVDVHVGQPPAELKCPRIELKHDEAGTIVSALCAGRGVVKQKSADRRQTEFEARWTKQLRVFPDKLSGLRVLELEGEARIKQPLRQTALAADTIRAWLEGEFHSDALATDAGDDANEETSPTDNLEREIQIERMLAMNNVVIVSPRLQGITQRLEVLFDNTSTASPTASGHGLLGNINNGRLPRSELQLTSGAGRARISDRTDKQELGEFGSQPLRLRAERTRVHLRRGEAEEPYDVSQIFTTGDVLVTQAGDDGLSRALEMTGSAVSVVSSGDGHEVLHVEGQPAQIRREQVVLEGGNLTFDRGHNRSIVDGPGRLLIPLKNSLDGSATARPGRLEVRWKEQMDFDGQLATFYGQVQAHQHTHIMRCQEMQVTLDSRVSFTEKQAGGADETNIQSVRCIDGVEVESSKYEGSQLLSIRRARFWEFLLNQSTGDTETKGPGYITVWQRGQGQHAASHPAAVVLANRAKSADQAGWDYTRIDFFGKSVGNVNRGNTTFQDRVEIVYGPVHHPLETIDPDHLGKNGVWLRCQELQVASVKESEDRKAHLELLGKGNAELDGHEFHGLADQISYDQSKDLFTLRSLGEHSATLWRQTQPGGSTSRNDSQQIKFIRSKNQLELDKTTNLDLIK